MRTVRFLVALVAVAFAALAAAPSTVTAAEPGTGYGPGMMDGYGPGMMGYGPGMMGGYGPRMMGGYGPGMMGGYGPGVMGGYGPGMMGGGYGRGMMGGRAMMGPGMPGFGHGMQEALKLTDEQRKKLESIDDDLQGKQWEVGGKMRVEAIRMRDLMNAEPRDRAALDATFKRISDLRLEGFDAHLVARDQMEAVLTAEQKQQMQRWDHWRTGDND